MASGRDSTGQCATDGTGDNTTEDSGDDAGNEGTGNSANYCTGNGDGRADEQCGNGEEITVETISSGVFPAI